MSVVLRSKQGTKLHYMFQLFEPGPDGRTPDRTKPYDLSGGWHAWFTLNTHPRPHTMRSERPHPGHYVRITEEPGTIEVVCPASETETWHQGDLEWVLELIPPSGIDDKFAISDGVIRQERFFG